MSETGLEPGAPSLIGKPGELILSGRVTGCLLIARAGLKPTPIFDEPQESFAGKAGEFHEVPDLYPHTALFLIFDIRVGRRFLVARAGLQATPCFEHAPKGRVGKP